MRKGRPSAGASRGWSGEGPIERSFVTPVRRRSRVARQDSEWASAALRDWRERRGRNMPGQCPDTQTSPGACRGKPASTAVDAPPRAIGIWEPYCVSRRAACFRAGRDQLRRITGRRFCDASRFQTTPRTASCGGRVPASGAHSTARMPRCKPRRCTSAARCAETRENKRFACVATIATVRAKSLWISGERAAPETRLAKRFWLRSAPCGLDSHDDQSPASCLKTRAAAFRGHRARRVRGQRVGSARSAWTSATRDETRRNPRDS